MVVICKASQHLDVMCQILKQWFCCRTGQSPLDNSAIPHQWGIPHRLRTTALIIRFSKSLHYRQRYYEKYDKQPYLDLINKIVQKLPSV